MFAGGLQGECDLVLQANPQARDGPSAHPAKSRVLQVALSLILLAASIPSFSLPVQGSDTITRWDSFSESSNCGDPYTRTPYVSKTGFLSDSERILGPFGTYFGGSISEVKANLVTWTVPGSDGQEIHVNPVILPALKEVAAGLKAEAANGRVYQIDSVWAFTPRTIGGSHQLSRHALGLAIDINPATNPHSDELITDMPEWFVDIWRDAGFCWGGDWRFSKDAMHFSWMGPQATPSTSDSVDPLPPRTSKRSHGSIAASHSTEFAPVIERYALNVVDVTGNGAPDVVGLRSHPDGSVIDVAWSTYGYGECSIGRWFIDDQAISGADHVVFADVDGDSGQDLIALEAAGATLDARVATRRSGFDNISVIDTSIDSSSGAVTGADFDGDGRADLWEATDDGHLRVWQGPVFGDLLHDSVLPSGAPIRVSAGDRDGADTPELFALYGGESSSRVDVLRLDGSWEVEDTISLGRSVDMTVAIGAGDYDGDGRSDAQTLSSAGKLEVYIGNTSTGVTASRWFLRPDWECGAAPILLKFNGTFFDDEGNIFEADIESIATTGVTRGCNPPYNDRFCPGWKVTRAQMAAFLVRALGLTENTHPGFVDVPAGHTFAEDIGKLATAGITQGCNPPHNDRYCPGDGVSRAQMAAFMVRALGLTENTHPGFVDVPFDSTFVEDIGRLATEGITRGCNPPNNDMFCPGDIVTRAQMAAFLDRADSGA